MRNLPQAEGTEKRVPEDPSLEEVHEGTDYRIEGQVDHIRKEA
jgi:hypothetical protein